jgi:hypothetical protein
MSFLDGYGRRTKTNNKSLHVTAGVRFLRKRLLPSETVITFG